MVMRTRAWRILQDSSQLRTLEAQFYLRPLLPTMCMFIRRQVSNGPRSECAHNLNSARTAWFYQNAFYYDSFAVHGFLRFLMQNDR